MRALSSARVSEVDVAARRSHRRDRRGVEDAHAAGRGV